jgi:hypothetical protein
MSKARQLIDGALRLCGQAYPGFELSGAKGVTGLEVLSMMLGSWSTDRLHVPFVTEEDFNLVVGQASYTIGTSGSPDVSSTRPVQIIGAFVRDSSNTDHPVDIIGEAAYRGITNKSQSGRPLCLWYNPTVPNGTINTWMVANTIEALHIASEKQLGEPATITADVVVPRNYDLGIKWNLAVQLSLEYGFEPTQFMLSEARRLLRALQAQNAANKANVADLDVPHLETEYRGSDFNIYNP